MNEWKRNCPECNKELFYVSNNNLNRAIKDKSLCKSCSCRKYPIVEKYKQNCSICNKILVYKNRQVWLRAINCNSLCSSCGITINHADVSGKKNPMFGIKKSKEVCEKIRNSLIGKPQSIDTITKKINTRKNNGKEWHSPTTILKMRLAAIKRIERLNGQCMPNYNPKSILIIESKANELGITDLQHAENGGEFYIKELAYYAGGFSKEKNIWLEFLEKKHRKTIKKDNTRKTRNYRLFGM